MLTFVKAILSYEFCIELIFSLLAHLGIGLHGVIAHLSKWFIGLPASIAQWSTLLIGVPAADCNWAWVFHRGAWRYRRNFFI